jgi:hypothetical protein
MKPGTRSRLKRACVRDLYVKGVCDKTRLEGNSTETLVLVTFESLWNGISRSNRLKLEFEVTTDSVISTRTDTFQDTTDHQARQHNIIQHLDTLFLSAKI